jgi:two-component system cell cycle sensor histidine kinase/response regulator CckA
MTPAHPRPSEPYGLAEPPSSIRVLVVDDYPAVRNVTATLLTEARYIVQCASSGGDALSIITARPEAFDLLVTDLDMSPGMWGDELIVRAREHAPLLRVLVMTGEPDRLVERARLDERNVIILKKPFQAENLCRAVRQALTLPPVTNTSLHPSTTP